MQVWSNKELENVIDLVLEGAASSEMLAELASQLEASPSLRETFIDIVSFDSSLEFHSVSDQPDTSLSEADSLVSSRKSLIEEFLEEQEQTRREIEKQQAQARLASDKTRVVDTKPRFTGNLYDIVPSPVIFVCLAASILIVALMLLSPNQPKNPEGIAGETGISETSFTTLLAQRDAKWQIGGVSKDLQNGASLQVGQLLTLDEGFAEISTDRGAIAIVEAPAILEILDNPNAIGLHSGRLVGLCHTDDSKGFIVKTDHANITDLGTEFGVEVLRNSVTATVFVGQINFTPPGGQAQPVTNNQTARLTVDGNDRSLVVEDQLDDNFTRRLPRENVIADARISVEGFKIQVVPQGVYEDAILFTDRQYEINGIDHKGIPSFLLGGDLIRMPVDARPDKSPEVGDRLQLELDLSVTSDVYVLKSEITDAQDWLQRDYQYTGLKVGVDFAKETKSGVPTKNGIGPGKSIDRPFEIWKRKQPVLGPTVVAGGTTGSMYAVVVVPRETEP